jgi:glutamate synthase domain-containing protein 2
VSTVPSYTGAQIFEAIGIGDEVIGECFAGTSSRLGGVGFDQIATETAARHTRAFPPRDARPAHRRLEVGGAYQWRREGEPHLFSPETVFKLQHATRSRKQEIFAEYTDLVDDQSARLMTLRGLLRIRGVDGPAATAGRRSARADGTRGGPGGSSPPGKHWNRGAEAAVQWSCSSAGGRPASRMRRRAGERGTDEWVVLAPRAGRDQSL